MRHIVLVLALAAATLAAGCAQTGYYVQSVRGQFDLFAKRVPIPEIIGDPETPAPLRERLKTVLEMREFASTELGLPDNGSYRSFADIGRPYVVWNVFAADALSVEPQTWCFPFVGCLAYRGYFTEERARRFATSLRDDGADVYVAGIVAYSTLGHFADPVLNTMLRGDDLYVASVLFHELAHQQLYIRGDTEFNEAFASFVEEEGVRRWLAARGDTESYARWRVREDRSEEFSALVATTRERLQALYESSLPDDKKRIRKAEILAAMRDTHEQMRARLGTDTGYERWFSGPLNNAQLASVATYRRYVPVFRGLLDQNRGDLGEFYANAAQIGGMREPDREQLMERLLAMAPGTGSATRAATEPPEGSTTHLMAQ